MFLDLSKCYLYIIYVRINNVLARGVENENSQNSFASARGTGNNVDDDFYDYPKIIYILRNTVNPKYAYENRFKFQSTNMSTQNSQESVNSALLLTITPSTTMIIIMTMIMPRRTNCNAYNRVFKIQDSL